MPEAHRKITPQLDTYSTGLFCILQLVCHHNILKKNNILLINLLTFELTFLVIWYPSKSLSRCFFSSSWPMLIQVSVTITFARYTASRGSFVMWNCILLCNKWFLTVISSCRLLKNWLATTQHIFSNCSISIGRVFFLDTQQLINALSWGVIKHPFHWTCVLFVYAKNFY